MRLTVSMYFRLMVMAAPSSLQERNKAAALTMVRAQFETYADVLVDDDRFRYDEYFSVNLILLYWARFPIASRNATLSNC